MSATIFGGAVTLRLDSQSDVSLLPYAVWEAIPTDLRPPLDPVPANATFNDFLDRNVSTDNFAGTVSLPVQLLATINDSGVESVYDSEPMVRFVVLAPTSTVSTVLIGADQLSSPTNTFRSILHLLDDDSVKVAFHNVGPLRPVGDQIPPGQTRPADFHDQIPGDLTELPIPCSPSTSLIHHYRGPGLL